MFRELLPETIELVETLDVLSEKELFDEENLAIGNAIASRRREFSIGRDCARRALARFGVPPTALPIGPDRAPVWPIGFVGSITHCPGFCSAAVAKAEHFSFLGIDAERVSWPHEMVPADFLSPNELEWIASRPRDGSWWEIIFFSLKEALYKAWYPAHRCYLDFHDVELSLLSEENPGFVKGRPSVVASNKVLSQENLARFLGSVQIRYRVENGLVYSAVWG